MHIRGQYKVYVNILNCFFFRVFHVNRKRSKEKQIVIKYRQTVFDSSYCLFTGHILLFQPYQEHSDITGHSNTHIPRSISFFKKCYYYYHHYYYYYYHHYYHHHHYYYYHHHYFYYYH